jgi:hypothetical protein
MRRFMAVCARIKARPRGFRVGMMLSTVMQRTADLHYQITDACLPETAGVVDDATALDATVDVLDLVEREQQEA